MKALKVIVSGSYRTSDADIVDFSGLEGFVPAVEEDLLLSAVRKRYAPLWLRNNPKYTKRVHSIRECYVDAAEETEKEFSFFGKDIKVMTQEELQDLAVFANIREIPLYKKVSDREARAKAYSLYSAKILRKLYLAEDFNPIKSPPIIVEDAPRFRSISQSEEAQELAITNDFEGSETKEERFTIQELRMLAARNGIPVNKSDNYKTLYKKVLGNG